MAAIPASEVDHGWSIAECGMPETTQPPNGHGSQLLRRLQAIDLRGVESQTRQGDAAKSSSQIASPVLFFQARALLQFAIGTIFNVPAGAVGEASRQSHAAICACGPSP